jgi:peptidoglycan/LPS O-acetylase OafA/YrhL
LTAAWAMVWMQLMGTDRESARRLRELDGLRGLAALSVFFCHASVLGFPAGPWADGGAAVALFFVLSGYVLARSLLSHPQSYAEFVSRRILRLYPAYWSAIVLALLLIPTFNRSGLSGLFADVWTKPVTVQQLVKHLFLITPSIDVHRFDYPIWSLVVEMRVSLIFPLLVAAFLWLPHPLRFAALALSPVLAFVPMFLLGIPNVPMFLLGIALAVYFAPAKRAARIIAPTLIAGAALYGAPHYLSLGFPAGGYMSALGAALLIAGATSSPAAKRGLSLAPMRFLGEVSYSFYLVHLPVLVFVTSWLLPATHSGPVCILLALVATLLVATAFRYGIEIPAMRRGQRVRAAPTIGYSATAPMRP